MFHSSFFDFYIPYLCIIETLGSNATGPGVGTAGRAGGQAAEATCFGGPVGARSVADGRDD